MTTERIKELEAEIETLNQEKREIREQQFTLKVKNSSLDKKIKVAEWEIEQLKTIEEKEPKQAE